MKYYLPLVLSLAFAGQLLAADDAASVVASKCSTSATRTPTMAIHLRSS